MPCGAIFARALVTRIQATTDAAAAKRLTAVAQQVFGDQAVVKRLIQPQAAPDRAPRVAPRDVRGKL